MRDGFRSSEEWASMLTRRKVVSAIGAQDVRDAARLYAMLLFEVALNLLHHVISNRFEADPLVFGQFSAVFWHLTHRAADGVSGLAIEDIYLHDPTQHQRLLRNAP